MTTDDDRAPAELALEVERALKEGRLDVAEAALVALTDSCGASEDHDGVLTFRINLMLRRGETRDAYRHAIRFDTEIARALQAVCLCVLRDPLWEGVARSVREEATDPVQRAMDQLLEAA